MKSLNLKKFLIIVMIFSVFLFLLVACEDKTNLKDYSMTYTIEENEYQKTNIVFVRNGDTDKEAEFLPRFPKYLPDGFERYVNDFGNKMIFLDYKNSDGVIIVFSSRVAIDGYTVYVPFKDIELEKIDVAGTVVYYFKFDGDKNGFIWFDEGVAYTLDSSLDKKELIKIIEGVIK